MPTAALRVRACEPGERAEDIKALFRRNGLEAFGRVYDEAYPPAGGRSWIGEDASGAVVMHVGFIPYAIGDSTRTWRGGLLGDLMADNSHRDFFGPVMLVRQLVADLRGEGFELLYSDPTPISAGVLKAGGFKPLGGLRRHAMPTALPWRLYGALRGGRRLPITSERALDDAEVAAALESLSSAGAVRVRRVPGNYVARAGGPSPDTRWLWMETPDAARAPAALALIRLHSAGRRVEIVDLAWGADSSLVPGVILAASRWCADAGIPWMDFQVLEGSAVAAAARGVGFVPRADISPVVVQALGSAPAPPAASDWFLGRLDGSSWW